MIKFQKTWCICRVCNNCNAEEEVKEIGIAGFSIALCKKCRNKLKEFFENLISRYLNAVDLSTVKAFAKHAEDIIKEEEEEEKKDEYIAKEIVS